MAKGARRDLAAAVFGDPLEALAERAAAGGGFLGGFDERPAQCRRPLAGNVAEAGFAVELRTVGVSPAQAQRWRASGNRLTSPTSAMISIAV